MVIGIKVRKWESLWEKYILQMKEFGEVFLFYDEKMPAIEKVEVLLTTQLDEQLLIRMPNLKAVFAYKTGVDTFPLEKLKERNVLIFRSHINAVLVAEHAVALAYALLHRVPEFHRHLSMGNWCGGTNKFFWKSLSSLTVGIVGYGHVGREIFRMLRPSCQRIYVLNRGKEHIDGETAVDTLEELLQLSDLVFLALPKNEETENLINEKKRIFLKGKYLVNVGRAEVCEEAALYSMLENGVLAGYASDVWYQSPDKNSINKVVMPSKFPFEKLHNVVMSPHCATHVEGAHEAYIKDAVDHVIEYMKAAM